MHKIYRIGLFSVILLISFHLVTQIFIYKETYKNSEFSSTTTIRQFYQMEENTVDALFLGPSTSVTMFVPQVMYDEYGIRTYNLATGEQGLCLSYHLLQEAYKTQMPKIVVLDTVYLDDYYGGINTSEPAARLVIDNMPWSLNKWNLICEACKYGTDDFDMVSFLFPIVRFHERWKELTEVDFDLDDLNTAELKGYTAIPRPSEPYELGEICNELDECYSIDISEVTDPGYDRQYTSYLNSIVNLTREHDTTLILLSHPGATTRRDDIEWLSNYAKENNLGYINMLDSNFLCELDYVRYEDCILWHANVPGARKISSLMGQILTEKYGLQPVEDAQWESTHDYYEDLYDDAIREIRAQIQSW